MCIQVRPESWTGYWNRSPDRRGVRGDWTKRRGDGTLRCATGWGGQTLRTFYFDIDGTVLREDTAVVRQLEEMGLAELDRVRVIFDYCDGAFSDSSWFRREVSFVEDPHRRVRHIAFEDDWWYTDDLAMYYFGLENKSDVLDRELGRRVFVPQVNGDGLGLAGWLEEVASGS